MPAPDHKRPAFESVEPAASGDQKRPEAVESEAEKEAARRAIEAILALRARAKPARVEEILAWRHEGHNY